MILETTPIIHHRGLGVNPVHANPCYTLRRGGDTGKCSVTKINIPAMSIWTSVIDPCDNSFAIAFVDNFDFGSKRKGSVCCRNAICIEPLAACSPLPMVPITNSVMRSRGTAKKLSGSRAGYADNAAKRYGARQEIKLFQ